jgi:hypothetical protein
MIEQEGAAEIMEDFPFGPDEPRPAFCTDFLFARPGFSSGLARMFDFGGHFTVYNFSKDGRQADARALFADWMVTGQDLLSAVEKIRAEHPELAA